MGLNASKVEYKGGGDFVAQEVIAEGVYPGRLVQVLDMGLQAQRPYKGEDKDPVNEIMLTYEFVDEFMKDEDGNDIEDKPRWYSETIPLYPIQSDRANSTKRYKALDPKMEHGGDFAALTGYTCNVSIGHNPGRGKHEGKVFANIQGIGQMRPKDAEKCPELINPPKVFDLDAPDLEIFLSLPEWVQDKIKGNLEFGGSALAGLLDEDVPFDKEDSPKEEGGTDDEAW